MAGRNRGRWRERRDTISAKRRRRRFHRRDVERGVSYTPMPVEKEVARQAVRGRLWIGLLAVGVAAFCVLLVFVGPQTTFGTAALASFGFTSLSLAVASLLSARREESVHRLANKLEGRPLLEDQSGNGEDGSI